jgi:hypothetical protein
LLNVHKPRDRSHYERFRHFHETFYRAVEVGSVTPFSARALDRAFAGTLVTLARHLEPSLTPPRGAEGLAAVRVSLEQRLKELFEARLREQNMDEDERSQRVASVQERIVDLLDAWQWIIADYQDNSVELQYQRQERRGLKTPKPLLYDMLDDTPSEQSRKFRTGRSLRGVEPSVNLFWREPAGSGAAAAGDAVGVGGLEGAPLPGGDDTGGRAGAAKPGDHHLGTRGADRPPTRRRDRRRARHLAQGREARRRRRAAPFTEDRDVDWGGKPAAVRAAS